MRHPKLLLAAALVALGACKKDAKPCESGDVFQDVSCIRAAYVKADVDYLASPALEGRRAGREGNQLAANLVEQRFTALGLEQPVGIYTAGYRQVFEIDDWEPTAQPTLSAGGNALAFGTEFDMIEFSPSGSASGQLAFVGYGLQVPPFLAADYPDCPYPEAGWDELAGIDLTGKIAVLVTGAPAATASCPAPADCGGFSCYSIGQRIHAAAAAGANGALLVFPFSRSYQTYPFWQIRGAEVPVLQVARDALATDGLLPDLLTWMAAIDGGTRSSHATTVAASLTVAGGVTAKDIPNVIGVVPGTDPNLANEVVVIGAHFDHMGKLAYRDVYYPGADDNASGTAVLLELARAVAASPTRPARTLVFAAWNAEEWGLWGSGLYVYSDPIFPIADTVAAFSIDMVGLGDRGLMLSEPWDPQDGLLESIGEASAGALGLPRPVTQGDPEGGSDHLWFAYEGVPAVIAMTPTLDLHTTYHTPADVSADVDQATLEAAAKLAWAAIRPWALGTETSYQPALRLDVPRAAAGSRLRPGFVRE
jgi:hypothetical protein